jgi:hypothetical protein
VPTMATVTGPLRTETVRSKSIRSLR